MNCPIDQTILTSRTKNKITAFACPKCRGLLIPSKSILITNNVIAQVSPTPMACPHCLATMRTRQVSGHSVSFCHCGFVWLDEQAIQSLVISRAPKRTSKPSSSQIDAANILSDLILFAPELFEGFAHLAGGLVHGLEATGDAIIEFIAGIFSDL